MDPMLHILKPLLPNIPPEQWLLDRAHRALCMRRAGNTQPRDIMIRFYYYHTKETVIRHSREGPIKFHEHNLSIYQDLAPITLFKRKEWKPITDILHINVMRYAWCHPSKLLTFKDRRSHVLQPGSDPVRFLNTLGIATPSGTILPGKPTADNPALARKRYTTVEN
ncbi:Hypothetical predicted protein [Pelobates cultripes]|uniref:Uncharacterized protein n=1 Tax=Pelobates cultripes TaxID=61616 RepID=A0AAD1SGY5_PELCU|nr:Hypothetical predicted protein [Pelobates cultripes]